MFTRTSNSRRLLSRSVLPRRGSLAGALACFFWSGLATASYLPSTVFPTGLSEGGLPIGLQAVGGAYADYTCIEFARLMAEELGGFVPPPGF